MVREREQRQRAARDVDARAVWHFFFAEAEKWFRILFVELLPAAISLSLERYLLHATARYTLL